MRDQRTRSKWYGTPRGLTSLQSQCISDVRIGVLRVRVMAKLIAGGRNGSGRSACGGQTATSAAITAVGVGDIAEASDGRTEIGRPAP